MKKPNLTFFFLGLLLFLGNSAFCQTSGKPHQEPQKSNAGNKISLEVAIRDYGYPVLKNTGNADADYASYRQAKTEWIKNNPEVHKRIGVETPQNQNVPVRTPKTTL